MDKKKILKIVVIVLVIAVIITAITLIIIGLIPSTAINNGGSSCDGGSCTIG